MSRKWVVVFSAFLIAGMARMSEAAPTPQEPLVIELASSSGATEFDANFIVLNKMNEILAEKTGGAIQYDYKHGGQLAASDLEGCIGVQLGSLEATTSTTGNMGTDIPELGVLDLPFLFKDKAQAYDFIDNSPAMAELMKMVEEEFNCVVIAYPTVGFRTLMNNSLPIRKVSDLAGLKIRVMDSPLYMRLFSLLGANPTPMNMPDTLIGLQQGTVDGFDNPIIPAYTMGAYRMVKYFDVTNHAFSFYAMIVRRDIFESLSPEQQTILKDAGKEATAYHRTTLETNEKKLLDEIGASGTNVGLGLEVDEFRSALAPLYTEYRDVTGPELFDSIMSYLGIETE